MPRGSSRSKNHVESGLKLGEKNNVEGERMGGLEGESNLAQTQDRPMGQPMNRGVPTMSGVPRKGRKANSRG
jgi:hypothetical protein